MKVVVDAEVDDLLVSLSSVDDLLVLMVLFERQLNDFDFGHSMNVGLHHSALACNSSDPESVENDDE